VRILFYSAIVWLAVTTNVQAAGSIAIVDTVGTPQSAYAARMLGAAFTGRGHSLRKDRAEYRVTLAINAQAPAEGFRITVKGKSIAIAGGDARGLIYGALAVGEQVRNGTEVATLRNFSDKPALAFRGIKFNTPWDTYRPSSALDQHYATARDLKFWEAFLDMMAENRFNALSLWTMHPFTYMIVPKNFPEASKWTPAQFAEWQHLYREIFRMAKERGLDTYVVFWSIFVSEEFSKAHNVAKENFYPHYYVPGDTSDITKRYLRESVTQMLEEYPDLDGIGVSHGEGMAGMTPLARQQFVDEVYIAGALRSARNP
jgi:hypothetical protein